MERCAFWRDVLSEWLNNICPFKNWKSDNPTKSLDWYNRYNAVKHDRETEFPKATIQSLLEAISALFLLIYAQYGTNLALLGE